MTALLERELSKLSVDEKLRLIARLWDEIESDAVPPGVLYEDDASLEAELNRRLEDAKRNPEQRMTLEQFKQSLRAR